MICLGNIYYGTKIEDLKKTVTIILQQNVLSIFIPYELTLKMLIFFPLVASEFHFIIFLVY